MKILYLSAHAILEYDELKMFTELGHECFSHGAYIEPQGHYSLPRPGIPNMPYNEELAKLARMFPKTDLPMQLIDWCDVVVVMHTPEWLTGNFKKFRELKKPVIWRSIGQSTPRVEQIVRFYKNEGLRIIRYSPKEANIQGYAGQHDLIRFYKDPEEFGGYNGSSRDVVNFSQSLKGRRVFCHYEDIVDLITSANGKIYGTGNDDLGELNGGEVPYFMLKRKMQDSRAYVYGGTWPACYTLSFIEAWMTGIPIVALGQDKVENIVGVEGIKYYEVHELIDNEVNGFVSDDINYLKDKLRLLVNDSNLAHEIGQKGREKAIQLFGKDVIYSKWQKFLEEL
jgi:glycosyltransferase involved in cell wall biosynthesis